MSRRVQVGLTIALLFGLIGVFVLTQRGQAPTGHAVGEETPLLASDSDGAWFDVPDC